MDADAEMEKVPENDQDALLDADDDDQVAVLVLDSLCLETCLSLELLMVFCAATE